jgi:acetyl-CoA acetyltransferase
VSKAKVAVIGTAWSKIARRADDPLGVLAVDAARKAIAMAGIAPQQIDGMCTYPTMRGYTTGAGGGEEGIDMVGVQYLARLLGNAEKVKWFATIGQGSIASPFVEACNAITAGACDYALVWRALHNPKGRYGGFESNRAPGLLQFRMPYGLINNVADFAIPWSRYLAKYGYTRKDFAPFIVANRAWGLKNPNAVYADKPITIDSYLNDRMIADPLSLLDCDRPVDVAGAMVLTSADRAKDAPHAAYVTGGLHAALGSGHALGLALEDVTEAAKRICDQLWAMTRLNKKDISMLSIYDGFSFLVPLWLEALGSCPEGEALRFLADNGEAQKLIPMNRLGGSLSMGRVHGKAQMIEAINQVFGTSSEIQVPNVQHALTTIVLPSTGAAAFVFSKEP